MKKSLACSRNSKVACVAGMEGRVCDTAGEVGKAPSFRTLEPLEYSLKGKTERTCWWIGYGLREGQIKNCFQISSFSE